MSGRSRPRVLLLHGFLATHEVWSPLRRHAGNEVDLITPDLPGYGRSRNNGEAFSLDAAVDEVMKVVEREGPSHVVGHSMGGIVALAVAARMPELFKSVGLIGLPVFHDRKEGEAFIGSRGFVHRQFLARDGFSHFWCRVLHGTRLAWPPITGPFSMTPRHILTTTFDHSEAAHAGGLGEVVFAGLVPGLADQVRTRVSLLHGTRDRSAPEQPARALAERNGWPFESLDGARHQLIIDRPEYTWEWVRRTGLNSGGRPKLSPVAERRTLVE